MRRQIFVPAAIAALVALSGCGSSGDDSTQGSTEAAKVSESAAGSAQAGGVGSEGNGAGKKGTGAGKSRGSAEPAGNSTSEAQFAKRAEAICSEGRKRMLVSVSAFLRAQGSQSAEGLREATEEILVPEMEAQIDQIRELHPPAAAAQRVEFFLSSWQSALDSVEQRSGSLAGTEAHRALAPVADLARKAGLAECAYG